MPAAWLQDGAELEVTVPKLLACDRCDGGGCNRCERSGGLRVAGTRKQRKVRVELPGEHDGPLLIRLTNPFEDGDIEQLMVQVSAGDEISKFVHRVARAPRAPAASEQLAQVPSQQLLPVVPILVALSILL